METQAQAIEAYLRSPELQRPLGAQIRTISACGARTLMAR